MNGTLTRRPAETGGLSGAVVLLIVRAAGVTDPDVIVALGVIVGAVPTVVTWLAGVLRRRNGPPSAPSSGGL